MPSREMRLNMLKELLINLQHFTFNLKRASMLIVVDLVFVLATFVALSVVRENNESSYALNIVGLFLSLSGIAILYYIDINRKRGLVLYESITDEMEIIRTTGPLEHDKSYVISVPEVHTNDDEIFGPLGTEARMKIRTFLHATNLPIIPGNAGYAFYLAVFVLSIIANATIQFTVS